MTYAAERKIRQRRRLHQPALPSRLPAIDKSTLALTEPKRLRDKAHLKVSDLFTVRSARVIIGSCIRPATKRPGGKV